MRHHLLAASVLLATASTAFAAPFEISADGQEVTDTATGLVWRRCSEGMQWNGKECAGEALMISYDKATAHAKSQATGGKAWRLPTLAELTRIVDKSQPAPTIDRAAFPNTPAMQYWSSTLNAKENHRAHFVWFATGQTNEEIRQMPFHVRLVRGK